MDKVKPYLEKYKIVIIMILTFGVLYFSDIRCIIKWFTGISCPGCGLTRAYRSLLRLDFKSAFYYHPLFWLAAPVLLFILCSEKPLFNSKRYEIIFYVLMIALFIGVYIVRLYFLKNDIVFIDIPNSFMIKLWKMLKGWI